MLVQYCTRVIPLWAGDDLHWARENLARSPELPRCPGRHQKYKEQMNCGKGWLVHTAIPIQSTTYHCVTKHLKVISLQLSFAEDLGIVLQNNITLVDHYRIARQVVFGGIMLSTCADPIERARHVDKIDSYRRIPIRTPDIDGVI